MYSPFRADYSRFHQAHSRIRAPHSKIHEFPQFNALEMVPVGLPTGTFNVVDAILYIPHFAGRIQGFVSCILHFDRAILEFIEHIQGFEPHIQKFMNSAQLNALEMVPVGQPTGTFTVVEAISCILHFAGRIQGFARCILHFERAILNFKHIYEFEPHIQKFM